MKYRPKSTLWSTQRNEPGTSANSFQPKLVLYNSLSDNLNNSLLKIVQTRQAHGGVQSLPG